MASSDEIKLEPAVVAALYVEHAEELRRFLVGLVRDSHLAADVLQAAFAKAVEQGHTAQRESLKSWLFTVAYREAMLVRRRQATAGRAIEQKAQQERSRSDAQTNSPDRGLVRWETVERVRRALAQLPAEQAEVVRRRIFREQKFAEIATELGVPLGTVLTRMQLALGKLRKSLGRFDEPS